MASENTKKDDANSAAVATPPTRCIFNDTDMEGWNESPLKYDLLRVVGAMGKSCATPSSELDDQYEYSPDRPLQSLSPAMAALVGALQCMLETWVQDNPPHPPTPAIRFGNPAFREWHAQLVQRSHAILQAVWTVHRLTSSSIAGSNATAMSLEEARQIGYQAASTSAPSETAGDLSLRDEQILVELSHYLNDAFGHAIRLDYGTGHETSFMVCLYGLCKLGCLDETVSSPQQPPSRTKLKATTLAVFNTYLQVTRPLQTIYRLEPAGSHGVWGLDDYHCLPFYFGACQLQAQPQDDADGNLQPRDIVDAVTCQRYKERYLYFGCIHYIGQLKKGVPLFEGSPMLYDISQTCPTWTKVASGLLRLYEGEVLHKRQVVQHLTFGPVIFVATWKPSHAVPPEPPTTTFRTAPDVTGRAPWATGASTTNPMARAPWATANEDAGGEMTIAPWAADPGSIGRSDGNANNGPMPPTKAPWAN